MMQGFTASALQAEKLGRFLDKGPVILVYFLRHADPRPEPGTWLGRIEPAISAAGTRVHWFGRCVLPLNMTIFSWDEILVLEIADAASYARLEAEPAYRSALSALQEVEVHVCRTSAASRSLVAFLQRLMPLFAPREIYSSLDITSECISGIDPTVDAVKMISSSPDPGPICIFNFHKYREQGIYPTSVAEHLQSVSGQRAYMRYGRAALRTVLGRRNRLVLMGQYGFCLIGNQGEPQSKYYDEVTLMQYHSRTEFMASFSLKAMEGRIRHRRAGLERCIMIVNEPYDRYRLA